MNDSTFQAALDALLERGTPRVWSLIVTVFGDLAQGEGDAISGPALAGILTPLGIKPEAMRVALHRLRHDGWLDATKQGRTSLHSLTDYGRRESIKAGRLIYRTAAPSGPDWHIRCSQKPAASPAPETGALALAPGVWLCNAPAPAPDADMLVFSGTPGTIPHWVTAAVLPKNLTSEFKDLLAALTCLRDEMQSASPPRPLQAACLRVLIVHRWRRLILKTPDLPDAMYAKDWAGLMCRDAVHAALSALPQPDLSELA